MKINIKRINDDFLMEATNDTNNTLLMDGSESIGGHNKGMRPMQLLLVSIGGCSAIDIISILKKQRQDIQDFQVEVESDSIKVEDHSVFKDIEVKFLIQGTVDLDKAKRAAELSFTKYCSVSKALEYGSNVSYSVYVNGQLA